MIHLSQGIFFRAVLRTAGACIAAAWLSSAMAAETDYSRQDVLRGSVTTERAWWNLLHYDLDIVVDIGNKKISGRNTMSYEPIAVQQRLQIELQEPMVLESVLQNGQLLDFEKDGYSYFIQLPHRQELGRRYEIEMTFSGVPIEAERPPWDGGLVWSEDAQGTPFIATAVQGIGASVWWPNKDHPYDEPDEGILISVEVPQELIDVSNGRLLSVEDHPRRGTRSWHWQVANPINNYGVNINIADYAHWSDEYQGEKGALDLDFYVLKENLEKARVQFQDVERMLEAFEYWFGPYPFYEDGYKLVEVPYLGMEHQSSVTYGNGYQNGYLGRDRSSTGWGMKWDFIIVHESAHEWFANSITNKDTADMWIHESFTSYAESLFIEYHFGKEAAAEYVRGTRDTIRNEAPVIGDYDLNRIGADIYTKGANLLHMIRTLLDDDEKWRDILRGMNSDFYHQTVTTGEIEGYLSQQTGLDLGRIFDQYLRDSRLPVFEYRFQEGVLRYRWTNTIGEFDMPLRVTLEGEDILLNPTTEWQQLEGDYEDRGIEIDPGFYVAEFKFL